MPARKSSKKTPAKTPQAKTVAKPKAKRRRKPKIWFGRAVDNRGWELRINGELLRLFSHRATNLIRILQVFQELGWPPYIEDPLVPNPDCSQSPGERLRDAVFDINQTVPRDAIHFHVNEFSESVRFELGERFAELELALV